MSKKTIRVSDQAFRALMEQYGLVESPAPIERSAAGLIFEAVCAPAHTVATCAVVDCPCKELLQPFASSHMEEWAVIMQVERGLTIVEARASLKDW